MSEASLHLSARSERVRLPPAAWASLAAVVEGTSRTPSCSDQSRTTPQMFSFPLPLLGITQTMKSNAGARLSTICITRIITWDKLVMIGRRNTRHSEQLASQLRSLLLHINPMRLREYESTTKYCTPVPTYERYTEHPSSCRGSSSPSK